MSSSSKSTDKSRKSPPSIITVPNGKRQCVDNNTIDNNMYPVLPNMIQFIKTTKKYVNHTYRDFSNVPIPDGMLFEIPSDIANMSFMLKVSYMLSTDMNIIKHSIQWCRHGRAIRIQDDEYIEGTGLLPRYFGCNLVRQFQRLLRIHGFKEITKGPDAGCMYSEFFLRGLPHLTMYAPEPIERRKQLPDPNNEPNLYVISELFPLPDVQIDMKHEAIIALTNRGLMNQHPVNDNDPLPNPYNNTLALTSTQPSTTTPMMLSSLLERRFNLNGNIPNILNGMTGYDTNNIMAAASSSSMIVPSLDHNVASLVRAAQLFEPPVSNHTTILHNLLLQYQQQQQERHSIMNQGGLSSIPSLSLSVLSSPMHIRSASIGGIRPPMTVSGSISSRHNHNSSHVVPDTTDHDISSTGGYRT